MGKVSATRVVVYLQIGTGSRPSPSACAEMLFFFKKGDDPHDQRRELPLRTITATFSAGGAWLLARKNDNEGVVERHTLDDMARLMQDRSRAVVLKLYKLSRRDEDESSSDSTPAGSKCSRAQSVWSQSNRSSKSKRSRHMGHDARSRHDANFRVVSFS